MNKLIKNNLLKILIMFLTTGVSSFFIAILPCITVNLIDNVSLQSKNVNFNYAILYIVTVCGILLFEYFVKISSYDLMKTLTYQLKTGLMNGILNLSQNKFSEHDTNYYIGTITEDVRNVYDDYYSCLFGMICSGIRSGIYIIFMYALNTTLANIILVSTIISLLVPQVAGKKLSKLRNDQSKENANYLRTLKEIFMGFTLVDKNTKKALYKYHSDACNKRELATYTYYKFKSFVEIFAGFTLYFIYIAAFIGGIILIEKRKITIGKFIGLLSFIDLVTIPIKDTIYQSIGMRSSKILFRKLDLTLKIKPEIKVLKKYFESDILIKKVNYKVGNFCLSDINLEIEKGKKYAIVGKSGSGKSTLLKIIAGREPNFEGSVTIDNMNIKCIDVSHLLSVIDQDTVIFSGSAFENITMFGSYNNCNLNKYIKAANAAEIVCKKFGENGNLISGGEKNKVAILRALAKESKLLLCDEMFSALDENNKSILSDFLLLDKELTIVSVTHDISEKALKYYDKVIIMEQGQIISWGDTAKMIQIVKKYFEMNDI